MSLSCRCDNCVLEFKSTSVPSIGAVDQVRAYARDLEDYHAGSQAHGRVVPILVLAGISALHSDNEEVIISGADEVGRLPPRSVE